MLASVYGYRVMVKSICCCCVRGRWLPSNPVTYIVTLLEITTRLVDDVGHGFSFVLRQFECNEASLWAISP